MIKEALKNLTCHWRGWDNLSFGLLEESIFLIIEEKLPHQEGLKQKSALVTLSYTQLFSIFYTSLQMSITTTYIKIIITLTYLFGNVFSIFSENSASNKDLTGPGNSKTHTY